LPLNAKKNVIEAKATARNSAVVAKSLWEKKNSVTKTLAIIYASTSNVWMKRSRRSSPESDLIGTLYAKVDKMRYNTALV
jgi:hypothetical protein